MQSISKKTISLSRHRSTFSLLFLGLPGIIFIFIFNYIPLYGLILPFKNYIPKEGFFGSPWSGLYNFEFLFTSNQLLSVTWNTVMMNTLFFTFNTIFSVLIALLLYELRQKYVKIYQTIFFMPFFLSWVIISFVGMGFLDSDYGLINQLITQFGGQPISFYTDSKYWTVLLVIFYLWRMTGYGAIIYYAGLVGLDHSYYEAAEIDGASKLQQIRYLSIPLILPLIIIINILAIGKVFYGDIGLFYNVTMDSPMLYPVTDVIDTYVLRALRNSGDFGMASAAGLYQSVCGFILVLVTNWIVGKINSESSLF